MTQGSLRQPSGCPVPSTRRGVATVWNLRAGIKARAMQLHPRTQLLDEETTTSSLEHHSGDLEHPAELARNLFVGIYFKSGGFPWTPVGLTRRHLPSRHHLLPALRRGLSPPDISRSAL